MITRIVAACARRPYLVLAAAALTAAAGYASQRGLARDAIPDLSDPQLVLVAEWMGHPAPEVASQVTQVITGALEGIPGSKAVRGSSMADMAYVDVGFGSAAALPAGRAEIVRRVDALRPRLPAALHIQIGPEASATGWGVQYALRPPEGKKPMPMGRRSIGARALMSARCASSRTRCCGPRWSGSRGSPRWPRSGASVTRWSSRPPMPSYGPPAPPSRTSRRRCG